MTLSQTDHQVSLGRRYNLKFSNKTIGGERRFESYPAASKMEAGSQVVRQPPTILFEK